MLYIQRSILFLVVSTLCSLQVSRIDAAAISIPNGDFETLYKPGSTTITAQFNNDYTNGISSSVNLGLATGATYSDATTGTNVAVPEWVGAGTIAKFPTLYYPTYEYTSKANTADAILSANSLGAIVGGSRYILTSQIASEVGSPPSTSVLILQLYDATTNTPIVPTFTNYPNFTGTLASFTTPVTYTSTYDIATMASHVGNQLKIQIGKSGGVAAQLHFDNLALNAVVPEPTAFSLIAIGGLFAARCSRQLSRRRRTL